MVGLDNSIERGRTCRYQSQPEYIIEPSPRSKGARATGAGGHRGYFQGLVTAVRTQVPSMERTAILGQQHVTQSGRRAIDHVLRVPISIPLSPNSNFYCRCDRKESIPTATNSPPSTALPSNRRTSVRMRGKRAKQYRKLMQQYGLSFGFREPYQVLGMFYHH
jgi:hypothetical protein